VRIRAAVFVAQAIPRARDELDRGALDLRILPKKMARQHEGELLDHVAEMFLREDVHGILHRVGRHDFAVVVGEIGAGKISFERDRGLDFMHRLHAAALAHDAQDADAVLAVFLRGEPGHHEV
jgi:hypothetical protein